MIRGTAHTLDDFDRIRKPTIGMFDHLHYIAPGALEVLSFASGNYATGLVTSRGETLVGLLEGFHIKAYFQAIVGREDVGTRLKPDPKGILIALERLGAKANSAFYVGNDANDMIAARRVGVIPVLYGQDPLALQYAKDHGILRVETHYQFLEVLRAFKVTGTMDIL
ncbi:MAG: HAD-IA family hydrolase [Candidatus Woesearchaeota archaeon]